MTLVELKANDKLVKDIIKIADEFYEDDLANGRGFTKETLFDRDSPMLPIIKAALRKSRISRGNKNSILLEEISKELRKPHKFGDKSSTEAMEAIINQSETNRNCTMDYVISEISRLINYFRENEGFNSVEADEVYRNEDCKRLVDAIFTTSVKNSIILKEVPYDKINSMLGTSEIKRMIEEFAVKI